MSSAIGVTEMRLFTMGMPYSDSSARVTGTSLLGGRRHALVDALGRDVDIGVGTAAKRQAQGDGADVEALLLDHQQRFHDLLGIDVHGRPFGWVLRNRTMSSGEGTTSGGAGRSGALATPAAR